MARIAPLWTFDELAARVREALADGYGGVANGRVTDVPNPRTLRFYVTLGLLDRPAEMRGRTAFYGARHLQQVVATKRLQAEGLSLEEVQARLAGMAPRALAQLARVPERLLSGAAVQEDAPPARSRRDEAFWARPPAEEPAEPVHPCTLPLHAQLSVHLTATRPLTPEDVRAIREAAQTLLGTMKARGLIPAADDKEAP